MKYAPTAIEDAHKRSTPVSLSRNAYTVCTIVSPPLWAFPKTDPLKASCKLNTGTSVHLAMKCPNCSTDMEDGFMAISASEFVVIKWCKERKLTTIGGESMFGVIGGWIEAHRCGNCRIVAMDY